MLRNHGSRARRCGAVVLGFIFSVSLSLSAGCALSPVSESQRGKVDAEDAGDGDDRPRDGDDGETSPPAARRDSGTRSNTGLRDASLADGAASNAISARDGGTNQATSARDAAPAQGTPSAAPDAGQPDGGAGDASTPDTGTAILPAPQCQSGLQCLSETCPQFGLWPCCKSDHSCGCRPILGVCR